MNKRITAKGITRFAILLAFVILFQVFGSYIKIGTTTFNFVLIPVVLGALILGYWQGAVLGIASGVIIYIMGLVGQDPFTMILIQDHPVLTALTCLVKGGMAGLVPGIIYKFLSKKNKILSLFLASASAPIMNTGFFILGALLMSDTLSANFVADGMSVMYFLIIVCAGINFLVEFGLNIALTPAIHKVIDVVGGKEKSLSSNNMDKKEQLESNAVENGEKKEIKSETDDKEQA